MRFENRVALVTAAGAGIGRAIAVLLAAEGARVVVSDLSEAAGEETVALISSAGGTAVNHAANVAVDAEVRGLVQRAVDEFGALDHAVNNAGVGVRPTLLHEITDAEWARTVDVTLTGTFQSMRAELALMTKQGHGSIVNIASVAGIQSTPHLSPYGATKHGVVSLTVSAAAENASSGIRVNAVAPGPIETAALASLPEASRREYAEQVPMKRLGRPEDIAEATAFLLSDAAAFITGVTLPVDGGTLAR